jgi:prepilin-type processing-associated H-X9-DG protein
MRKLLSLLVFVFPLTLLGNDELSPEAQCAKNMQTLVRAIHAYHDTHDQFPPPASRGTDNKPLHSWRVLILPFIEGQAELYKAIRLNERWDSEHNKQFHDKMPKIFRCPACTLGNPERDTIYCLAVGNDMISIPISRGITYGDVHDGTSNTILMVERKTPVCWMDPTDVLQEHAYLGINKHDKGIGSQHPGGCNSAFCDGSTRFAKENIDLKILKAFLTRAGRETVQWPRP